MHYYPKAFSLIEVLVTTSIISLLLSVFVPAAQRAKGLCRSTICRSNIRQLYIANHGYSVENNGYYVLAARDLFSLDNGSKSKWGGMNRWHGVRQSDGVSSDPVKNTFDPLKGPLKSYLSDGKVKQCPSIVEFAKEGALNAFEAGCGGYGYNAIGVGSRTYTNDPDPMRSSMKAVEITKPAQKIMFTDTAFLTKGNLIEYSFCEPPKAVLNFGNGPMERGKMTPSIHFRHLFKASVVWCDGHTSSEELDFPAERKAKPDQLGWFGPENNSLFKP